MWFRQAPDFGTNRCALPAAIGMVVASLVRGSLLGRAYSGYTPPPILDRWGEILVLLVTLAGAGVALALLPVCLTNWLGYQRARNVLLVWMMLLCILYTILIVRVKESEWLAELSLFLATSAFVALIIIMLSFLGLAAVLFEH